MTRTATPYGIAVIGAGAIGGVLAAVLVSETSHRVRVCLRPGREAPSGFELRLPDGSSISATPEFSTDVTAVEPVDVVLLTTKAYDSAAAWPWLRALCRPGTVVAVCQNGVDQVERISPLAPTAAVVPVVVQFSAARTASGRFELRTHAALTIPAGAAGSTLADLFSGTSCEVRLTADFVTAAWQKLLLNSVIGGLSTLTLTGSSAFRENDLREATLPMAEEVIAVGRAEGAAFAPDAATRLLDRFVDGGSGHLPSIAADRRDGRPLEWEVRNAVVGRLGRRHGIPTPINDLVTALLRAASADPDRSGDRIDPLEVDSVPRWSGWGPSSVRS
ncbi:MAG: 2-dehydropantoate 2-reductase [Acidimicrobiia bacterium]